MRKQIVAGNWKMNLDFEEAQKLAQTLCATLETKTFASNIEVIIAPSFPYLSEIGAICKDTNVQVAAQNVAATEKGAFTGEVSATMLKSIGTQAVLVGHSERRSLFSETNEELKNKIDQALAQNLSVIFCCGETLNQREENTHFQTIKSQIFDVLSNYENWDKFVIAYEPVWAIGTGVTASSAQAQEMHAFIRSEIAAKKGDETAQKMTLLYGGSCKPSNADELFAQPDVDGGLIGGASLKADSFVAIIEALNASNV